MILSGFFTCKEPNFSQPSSIEQRKTEKADHRSFSEGQTPEIVTKRHPHWILAVSSFFWRGKKSRKIIIFQDKMIIWRRTPMIFWQLGQFRMLHWSQGVLIAHAHYWCCMLLHSAAYCSIAQHTAAYCCTMRKIFENLFYLICYNASYLNLKNGNEIIIPGGETRDKPNLIYTN